MSLYYLIFIIGKLCRFAEYLLRNLELSNIMQHSSNGKSIHIPVRHIKPSSEDMADKSYIHAMSKGRVVIHPHVVEHVKDLQSRGSLSQYVICIL